MREDNEHEALCTYMRYKHPKVIFNTDLSGIRLTQKQAGKVKKLRSSRGFPDITIYEPRGRYLGLFIELKRTGEHVYKKDGKLRANTHLKEQHDMILKLRERGYYADFAIGFDNAVKLVDWYLKLEKPER